MVQVQSYQGYFKNGQFMSPQAVELPEGVEVFITITGRKMPQSETWVEVGDNAERKHTLEQQAAIKFLKATEKINSEGFDPDTLEAFERWDNGEFKLELEDNLS